jgi:hypothetical protein
MFARMLPKRRETRREADNPGIVRRRTAPGQAPFAAFLDRDAHREKRRRGRSRVIVVSLIVHGVALLSLLFYSVWHVDELFGPSVQVTVFGPSKLPPEVRRQTAPSPAATPRR